MSLKLKQVPKIWKPKKACVYAISHPNVVDNLKDIISRDRGDVYVGVTAGTIAQRWRDHKALRARDNQATSRFIRDNAYDFGECFRVIFEGTEDQCYKLEYHLRSEPNMGLNQKIGGKLKHRKFHARYFDMIDEAIGCKHQSVQKTTGSDPYSDYICNDCGAPC